MYISIIVPVYKVEKYITRCIKSIMNQSCDTIQIECIIVDDCSPDMSMDIVREIVNDYRGGILFKLICHQKNQGLSAARNTGINNACGNNVMFLDSDDYLTNGAIKKLHDMSLLFPEAELIKGNYYSVKAGKPYPMPISGFSNIDDGLVLRSMFLNYNFNCTAWNQLINLQFLKKKKLYFDEGLLFEDTIWSYRLFKYINSAVLMSDVTYVYEDANPLSIMNTTNQKVDRSVLSIIYICNNILDDIYPGLFVDCLLYVYTFVIKALRLNNRCFASEDVEKQLTVLRKRLFMSALKSKIIPLVFYFLLMFRPFYNLYNISWFRKHNDFFDYKIRRMAKSKFYCR